MKRLLIISIFAVLSTSLFSQHLLDSVFASIKDPEIPEDKSLVYFIRYGISTDYVVNLWPISISFVSSGDTSLLATLIANNYNYLFMDPGDYEFIVSESFEKIEDFAIGFNKDKVKNKVNINLESGKKYFITVTSDSHFSYIFVEENEKGYKKLSKLRLSTFPPWVAIFYDIEENVFSKSRENEKEKVYLNNFLMNTKYVVGNLVGVTEESFLLNVNGNILNIDNLECKSIFFLKDIPKLPAQIDRNDYYENHILLSAANGEKIIDGLLFRGSEFLENVFFYQTFFDYDESFNSSNKIIHINTNKDFNKIKNLSNYKDN